MDLDGALDARDGARVEQIREGAAQDRGREPDGVGAGFRRDLNWWVLVIGPPILVFSIIGWLLFRDRKRRRAEEQTRSSERRRSLELTATFRPGDSAADGAFFSIPLDEEKPQFV